MTIEGITKEKSVVYSASAPKEFIKQLDSSAAKMGWSRAELIRQVAKYVDLVVNDGDFNEKVDAAAEKTGMSAAKVLETLVNKHLNLISNGSEEIPIILSVPKSLRKDPAGLKTWLAARLDFVYRKLVDENA